jgi:hypothetical protein
MIEKLKNNVCERKRERVPEARTEKFLGDLNFVEL